MKQFTKMIPETKAGFHGLFKNPSEYVFRSIKRDHEVGQTGEER